MLLLLVLVVLFLLLLLLLLLMDKILELPLPSCLNIRSARINACCLGLVVLAPPNIVASSD